MIEPIASRRMPRTTLKIRRQEIEQCLASFGFMPDLSRFRRRPIGIGSEGTHSQRLRQAMESLGPVFSAFGRYLSSRVDLLPIHACLDLALIAGRVAATPIAAVRDLIAREFGCPPEEIYPAFEELPFESRLMSQSHNALLKSGATVAVKVIRSELQEDLELDLELLTILRVAFTDEKWHDASIEDAVADFRYSLNQQTDFTHDTKVFEDLVQDARECQILKVPVVYKELSSSKIMTIEQVSGLTLENAIALFGRRCSGEPATADVASGGSGLDPDNLARGLCQVWLRQALLGSWFPVELRPEGIVVLPNTQIAFTSGGFARLPSDAKRNLWNYLIAASTEEPDKACAYLLRVMITGERPFDEDELRHRFRGIVPFRDGGWSSNGDCRSLAEHLFVHWRLMSERGLRPQHYLPAFYRGLFQTAAHARQLAPYSDPVLAGLHDVRTNEMLTQFRDMMRLSHLSDQMDKYAAMMMGLPQRLDDVLTVAAESSARVKFQATRAPTPHQQKDWSALVIALLLMLAAVVLFSHHLAASTGAGEWIDRMSAVVFVLLGALLLWAVSHA
jgi:predicted unusual protein kinase regulating ubiquinone biosynthesis (AarF/ABC1/UbiB family)